MSRFVAFDWVMVAGIAATAIVPSQTALSATEMPDAQAVSEVATEAMNIPGSTADAEIRFIQEDGPESGHVRVEFTPDTRALTILEARAAAQQAFLRALKVPGLGDDISRITVVVRLMPASHPDIGNEQVFLFLHKGGRDWSILSGN